MPDEDRSGPSVTVEQLHQQLVAAIDAIESGDEWTAWLDFASRMPQYSFRNLILIAAQRPDATAVASFGTWKAAHRPVQRGERSIKILAPVTRRTDVTDAEGRPVRDADGRPVRRQTVVAYRPASVFDIKQTAGPPIPEPGRPTLLSGEAPRGLWDALAAEVAERGYRLLRGDDQRLGTANGITVPKRREVWVRQGVDEAQAVKTLAHELAHVILHAADKAGAEACRGVIEVEAESVAYLTLAAHGMTPDSYSFPYVAHWAYPLAAVEHVPMSEIVARTGSRVIDTARTLIEITGPDVTAATRTASAAVTARTTAAVAATSALRDDAGAVARPPVKREILLGIVADSQGFFRDQVMRSWVPGYLAQRQLGQALHSHEIGHAPAGWTTLTDHLRSLGYRDSHIEASGMAVRARTGQLVDRFRDRLTLPLRDETGSIVAFTARSNPDAGGDAPKYLNSPTTSIYHKSEVLYGSRLSREFMTAGSTTVICEGPLGVVAVCLAGREAAGSFVGLAACGTAFTEAHARQVYRLASPGRICLAFDGDEAGRTAAEKVWVALTKSEQFDVSIAVLPTGSDPASLAASDPTQLIGLIRDAREAAFVLADERLASSTVTDDPGRRVLAFRELSQWADRIVPERRVEFVLHLANSLSIDPAEAAVDIGQHHPELFADDLPSRVMTHCASLAWDLDEARTRTDGDVASGQTLAVPSEHISIAS